MPLISVVIPFFNQLRFLRQSVESVLRQTHTEFEVVVVDDGSDEDPSDLVRSLNDPRIRLIRQTNAGVATARNTGIAVSNGEYFVFLDADDWLAPTMLEDLKHILAAAPDAGMAYSDIVRVGEEGEIADAHKIEHARDQLSGNILASLLLGGYFPPVCVMVRASALNMVGGFDQSLGGCCDWDMWLRIAAAGFNARFHSRELAYYRLHARSMSKDSAHMRSAAVLTLAKNMAAFPQQLASATHLLVETSAEMYSANSALAREKQDLTESLTQERDRIEHLEEAIAALNGQINLLTEGKAWLEQQWEAYKKDNENKQAVIDSLVTNSNINR